MARMNGREKTTIEWIPVSECFCDLSYQRPLGEAWVRSKLEEFDPDALGLPLVSERIGRGGKQRYAVIDGQNRIELVRRALGPDQLIQCEVVRGITVEWEAKEWKQRNTNRKPRLIDDFFALVRSGDEESVEINGIVKSVGLKVERVAGPGVVVAVKALQRIYRGDTLLSKDRNPKALKKALGICKETWGDWEDSNGKKTGAAFQGDILLAVGLMALKYGDLLDAGELIRKLQGTGGPIRVLGQARQRRESNGGSVSASVVAVIRRIFNAGRRTNKLPPFTADSEE